MIVDKERKENFYKLQMFVTPSPLHPNSWSDLYLDVREIVGWYIPVKTSEEDEVGDAINLCTRGGDLFTVKRERPIEDYLIKNCYPI